MLALNMKTEGQAANKAQYNQAFSALGGLKLTFVLQLCVRLFISTAAHESSKMLQTFKY